MKKKRAREDGEGKERKRVFPLPIIPRAFAIFRDTKLEPLGRKEGVPHFCSVNLAGFPGQVTLS